jgi:hypothetical protein
MELEIYNFDNLLQVIEQNNFKKTELITLLKDYWQKWKDAPEKPIFLGIESIDLEFQGKKS